MGSFSTYGHDDPTSEPFSAYCERMTLAGFLVFLDDNGRVRLQKMHRPPTALERGLNKHREVMRCLCKEVSDLTPHERETICRNDPRLGFHRHDDVEGAIAAISERYDFK